ncbi:SDR family NAD(P)-dependent oxidoreductase [Falsirhodobacter sp. 20TX0035]|uniref:SDR family NAD(P)-dependent oxidoreductase n=1 Tax=Falsirhodobacter sp. 20TX0035 TaxID=3022019 RepID=UPI002330A41A|nr:SDR family NAD(P)-dependent oxidoreductase [Falsirhodobacter sp. 20TX0035]MDB6453008.1 SDR family NAD(P)-dependent oxidoreductase [Falsirhodobacter sp. 20TX0035]
MTLALVTGASSGIGLELARLCEAEGFDLVIVANEPAIHSTGLAAQAVEADLATPEGCAAVLAALADREVDLLFLNAGTGLVGSVLEQDLPGIERIVNTNVLGTLRLLHPLARRMVARNAGRILVTGSIVGYMPGSWQAIYSASKAFLNSLCGAMADEMKGTDVTITCLMPGATETRFFERAGMQDTPVAKIKKDDPADVARAGFDAMLAGKAQMTPGLLNKAQGAAAEVLPAGLVAGLSAKMFKPKE